MVRALGLAAAEGLAAGTVHYAPNSVVGPLFGLVAAVAIVAIAAFGCAGHKKSPSASKGGPTVTLGAQSSGYLLIFPACVFMHVTP